MTAIEVMGTYWCVRDGESDEIVVDVDEKRIQCPSNQDDVRRAIVEAFAYECGNARTTPEWFGIVGPRIAKAWADAGA